MTLTRRMLLVVLLCATTPAFSELIVRTKDGRAIRVAVEVNEVASIEFVDGQPSAPPPTSTPPPGAILGSVWHQSENGWSGVWTRRGASNVFDGVWTKAGESLVIKGVLTITLTGAGNVTIRRQDTSQNAVVDYTGTIGANGSVTGTGRIGGNSYTWSATIR
jgi:hypothetical protein